MKRNNKEYFRGLDAFRGLAAVLVIVGHTELIKEFNSIGNFSKSGPFIFHLGEIAVTFFFVLSGFLITYLILIEEQRNKKIDIKSFYMRRVLRIWPVYFLMVVVGFFIFQNVSLTTDIKPLHIPNEYYLSSLIHYALFLPNISPKSNPVCFQAWSIGVEEQFYLIWPLIFFFITSQKKRLIILLAIYLGLPFIKLLPHLYHDYSLLLGIKSFFVRARFENMALGGIIAILLYKKTIPKNTMVQVVLIVVLIVFLVNEVSLPLSFETIIYPILFSNLILYTIWNVPKKGFLENPILKYLGRISYGLYMYHLLAIYLVLNLFGSHIWDDSVLKLILIHFCVIVGSVLVSSISYFFIEKPVLSLKQKFQ